ncbi:hypothetical protein GCM10010517_46980 [Streptosporangium fragile]|uniref:NAD(P)-binding domain-containing protein n=1 Tax=Streptosporangium fragile TaxID=46186 RepID=A0ABN3W1U7_9ACTN
MGRIIVFGAGGRAGRAAVEEARRRGHRVTAVVRDPARYGDLAAGGAALTPDGAAGRTADDTVTTPDRAVTAAGDAAGRTADAAVTTPDGSAASAGGGTANGVPVVAGDVTEADVVVRLAVGHDAAINAAADLGARPGDFFPAAARALLDGLARAGVGRLDPLGLASALETGSGTLLMDTPGYPQEYRAFYLGHAAGTDVLRTASTPLDWLVLSPAGDFDHGGTRTGRYRTAPAGAASRISYADFAIALLDEIDAPKHHRTHLGVEAG